LPENDFNFVRKSAVVEKFLTDPNEAKDFYSRTGIDSLAVAIGNDNRGTIITGVAAVVSGAMSMAAGEFDDGGRDVPGGVTGAGGRGGPPGCFPLRSRGRPAYSASRTRSASSTIRAAGSQLVNRSR